MHGDEGLCPWSVEKGSFLPFQLCEKGVLQGGNELWTWLLTMALNYRVLSLPCEANEVCDQTDCQ